MAIYNREEFLSRIAEKLGREQKIESVNRPTWTTAPHLELYRDFSKDDLVNMFETQCDVIHTHFKQTSVAELPHLLRECFDELNAQKVVIAGDPRIEEYGLNRFFTKLTESDFYVHTWEADKGDENIEFAANADVGITFSDITLAESGTVVLLNDSGGKGRSVSLLPRTYIAIIPKSSFVPRMTQAMQQIHIRVNEGKLLPSCINLISGPSNSADIEMNLIVGVHGPVRATYIVVSDK
ncbi:LutC/YkgG family protein [Aneurinibacillus uraniidurans]|uniref:LutC/YkgG family protein n=1 Tax=Aneurinibacillus uraniidurans TaxID=2966586 RepID=UPI0023493FAA|nr:lactate utilization protein C [Aneurinibacillus sp. B1]WCN36752.1 lactate utilization protein C [Aneurinibacillus sp. B1]